MKDLIKALEILNTTNEIRITLLNEDLKPLRNVTREEWAVHGDRLAIAESRQRTSKYNAALDDYHAAQQEYKLAVNEINDLHEMETM